MDSSTHGTRSPQNTLFFELDYNNDLDQEKLNRRFRKPGEPPYVPSSEDGKTTKSQKRSKPKKRAGGSGRA